MVFQAPSRVSAVLTFSGKSWVRLMMLGWAVVDLRMCCHLIRKNASTGYSLTHLMRSVHILVCIPRQSLKITGTWPDYSLLMVNLPTCGCRGSICVAFHKAARLQRFTAT